jgi:hypothetical protein
MLDLLSDGYNSRQSRPTHCQGWVAANVLDKCVNECNLRRIISCCSWLLRNSSPINSRTPLPSIRRLVDNHHDEVVYKIGTHI